MAPKFGTSGLRGLFVELTDDLVADHVRAFLASCDVGPALYVGGDLRDSTPHLQQVIAQTAREAGKDVVDCGALPTPALALAAVTAGCGAVMVTGSHIPADRNGLKFYSTAGEITKDDEAAILAHLGQAAGGGEAGLQQDAAAMARFHDRYLQAFGAGALRGARIGVYSHSSVGRDFLIGLLGDLGADVVEFGRATGFVPVDTEAVPQETRAQLRDWAGATALDAIISTDGDADRPLLTDATGEVIPGDVLGQITAQFLGAEVVVTPVSSNSGVDLGGAFGEVVRTRIGSPYVIAAMQDNATRKVVGYEANGGFLLGFDAACPAGRLPALMTRDCVLPIVAVLMASYRNGRVDVAARVAQEPPRFTGSDRVENIPTAVSAAFLGGLRDSAEARAAVLEAVGMAPSHRTDLTDGLRMTDEMGRVLHLRPSGNAPEFRVYAETDDRETAQALLRAGLAQIGAQLRPDAR